MKTILNDKWLERFMLPLYAGVLVMVNTSDRSALSIAMGYLSAAGLAAFLIRLAVLIARRRRGIRSAKEDPRIVRRRENFYAWLGLVWFVLLFASSLRTCC